MLQQVYTATQLCYPKKLIHKFRHLNKLAPPLPPPKTRQKANRRRPHNQKQKENHKQNQTKQDHKKYMYKFYKVKLIK